MAHPGQHDGYQAIAEFYDYVGPYRDRPDVPFYVGAATNAGGPVLEVGCGTGRILIPVARAGAAIVGIDLSSSMLRLCQERLQAESAEVRAAASLVQADMRDFVLGTTFALATFPFRSFQHLLTVEDQIACLTNVHRHLEHNGRLIVDLFNPSLDALANRKLGEETGHEPEFVMADGRRVVRSHRIVAHDRFNQVNQVELIYSVTSTNGRTERLVHAFGMRYLFRFEIEHLLARCGFQVEEVHAGYDGSTYGSTYPGELVVVARKTA